PRTYWYPFVRIGTRSYALVHTRTHSYSKPNAITLKQKHFPRATQSNSAQTKAFPTCDPKQFRSDKSISHVRPKAIPLRPKHFPRATQSNSAQTKTVPTCRFAPVLVDLAQTGTYQCVPMRTSAYQCRLMH